MTKPINFALERTLRVACQPDGIKASLKDTTLNALAKQGLVQIRSRHAAWCVWEATEAGRRRAGVD